MKSPIVTLTPRCFKQDLGEARGSLVWSMEVLRIGSTPYLQMIAINRSQGSRSNQPGTQAKCPSSLLYVTLIEQFEWGSRCRHHGHAGICLRFQFLQAGPALAGFQRHRPRGIFVFFVFGCVCLSCSANPRQGNSTRRCVHSRCRGFFFQGMKLGCKYLLYVPG